MVAIERASRILMYSHDTFGLGHLRRTRAIAHSLVRQNPNLSVLILTGSPIIGSFDFSSRVDFVRIPGVIKLRNGDYTSLKLHMDIEETLAMRASIIKHTAEAFDPDLFIVDKEPLGLRGEVEHTLHMLKDMGVPLVLGLRDVMDDPDLLEPEWERKGAMPALENLYDEIWVYGLPQICKPLDGMHVPESVLRKMVYTGYLEREVPSEAIKPYIISKFDPPYLLVTPGGGGDGDLMVDWVLRAYENHKNLPYPALIVFGPFMQSEQQNAFDERINKLEDVEALSFDAHMESLMDNAAAIVAMGGYNTFCEILSFNKPAMIIPRTRPRMEQFIRASSAQSLGLVSMLEDDNERRPDTMATALRQLPQQKRPSDVVVPGLMDGLDSVNRLTQKHLDTRAKNRETAATLSQISG
ncbi:glycosyltransferase family protein [Curvivirga aplysinae]|uniref:glycosyltransferase family protein n=1 Tax=Curvivirga aplysinae TaxID=2529852 RepID=UPI001C3FACB8|nr:glycosyltransferase [Curvivirga aplysinae]